MERSKVIWRTVATTGPIRAIAQAADWLLFLILQPTRIQRLHLTDGARSSSTAKP
jgi:hypothetical protein